jgi:hypothetical protein
MGFSPWKCPLAKRNGAFRPGHFTLAIPGCRSCGKLTNRRKGLADLDGWVCLYVLLIVTTAIGNSPGSEVYVIAHHSGTPGRLQKLRKRTLACLIDS